MSVPVVTRRRIDAGDPDYDWLRDDVCALLRRHDFEPNDVLAVAYDVIDCPALSVDVVLQREDPKNGRMTPYIEHPDDCPDPARNLIHGHDYCPHIAKRTVDVALIGDLPDWWQPTKGSA